MRKAVAVAWFEHVGHFFGIVITQNSQGEHKAWIGVVAGIDQTKDIINIANYGAKFPLDAARLVINYKGQEIAEPIEIPG